MAGVEPLLLDSGHLASPRCVVINSVLYGLLRNGGRLQNGGLCGGVALIPMQSTVFHGSTAVMCQWLVRRSSHSYSLTVLPKVLNMSSILSGALGTILPDSTASPYPSSHYHPEIQMNRMYRMQYS
jgi:hypothetical protein